jgi:hypothetical protein
MRKLESKGVKHYTAFDSIVYHFQNGEMFEWNQNGEMFEWNQNGEMFEWNQNGEMFE